MAFAAMESVRRAEQEAENRIQESLKNAEESVENAKKTHDSIVCAAQSDAQIIIAHNTDKASAKAEEIIVTARNSALLEADKLRSECAALQDAVNSAIIKLIK